MFLCLEKEKEKEKNSSTCLKKLANLPYCGPSWKFGNNTRECICLLEIFSFYFLINVNGCRKVLINKVLI